MIQPSTYSVGLGHKIRWLLVWEHSHVKVLLAFPSSLSELRADKIRGRPGSEHFPPPSPFTWLFLIFPLQSQLAEFQCQPIERKGTCWLTEGERPETG